MNPMMGPMMGSMPQNGMMDGMPSTTMGNMGPTSSMGMGPSGMAGQGYYNTGMGGFQGGFNMGPPSPSPCMGLILKATGIPFKATVNLSMDLGLLNLSIPHRRTPLLRSNLLGNPSLPHNIHSTP